MVIIDYDDNFQKLFSKIKDPIVKQRIIKQIIKLKESPELGKPMRYSRKGTRELYISPFRLSYIYLEKESMIKILELYHKDR